MTQPIAVGENRGNIGLSTNRIPCRTKMHGQVTALPCSCRAVFSTAEKLDHKRQSRKNRSR
jgi:hypothetical protein